MTTALLSLRITDLARDKAGVWRAVVYADGQSRVVDRSQGSWRVTPQEPETGGWRHVLPAIAAELQRLVRKHERRASADPKEITMSAATATPKATKPAKAGKAKPAKATTAKAKPAAKKATKKPAAKGAPRASREEAQAKAAKALKLHEEGKSYVEVATACGWANPGVAWNAVARAKKLRDAK